MALNIQPILQILHLTYIFFQPELNSNIILSEKQEPKIRKPRDLSPTPYEKISLKTHKFEKVPKDEHVRKYN